MRLNSDTIAALATPPGEGGIAIVRLSGPNARRVLEMVFKPHKKGPYRSQTLRYGSVFDGNAALDEALAVVFRAPRSYTGEDVCEIHTHGSPLVAARVLALCCERGARPADAGEFTLRAFLNGRIDLAQAESVMDIITSRSQAEMRAASVQMHGALSLRTREMKSMLTDLLADIDACTDFPEEDVEETTADQAAPRISRLCGELRDAIVAGEAALRVKRGARVAIVGAPNAGKSSLLNALVGESRAIVSDIPGTTRDVVRADIELAGMRVELMDTAGLRETADAIEREGVGRARAAAANADAVMLVVDAANGLTAEDEYALTSARGVVVVALNKSDLPPRVTRQEIAARFPGVVVVPTTALTREGLAPLRSALEQVLISPQAAQSIQSALLTSRRHIDAAGRALSSLDQALSAIKSRLPLDCAALDIRAAWDALGEITGETASDDILARVFSRFCVGK